MTVSSLIGERVECQSQDGRGDARIECQYQGEIGRCCAEAGGRSQDWKNVGNLYKLEKAGNRFFSRALRKEHRLANPLV